MRTASIRALFLLVVTILGLSLQEPQAAEQPEGPGRAAVGGHVGGSSKHANTANTVNTANSISELASAGAHAFTLSDQFGQEKRIAYPQTRPSVLIFADRAGSEQVEGWVRPLHKRYGEQVFICGVAELSAVPAALRGVIGSMFKHRVKYPVLLDWTGAVSRGHQYQGGKASLLLIDDDGAIRYRLDGPASAERVAALEQRIDGMMDAAKLDPQGAAGQPAVGADEREPHPGGRLRTAGEGNTGEENQQAQSEPQGHSTASHTDGVEQKERQ